MVTSLNHHHTHTLTNLKIQIDVNSLFSFIKKKKFVVNNNKVSKPLLLLLTLESLFEWWLLPIYHTGLWIYIIQ